MRSWLLAAAAAGLLLLVACAPVAPRVAAVQMPGSRAGDGSAGSVTLVVSREVENAVVAIDGVLVADSLRTRRLHIRGVRRGYANVALAADGIDREVRVWVEPGRDTAVPVGTAPPLESDNPVLEEALGVGGYLLSRGLSAWLF